MAVQPAAAAMKPWTLFNLNISLLSFPMPCCPVPKHYGVFFDSDKVTLMITYFSKPSELRSCVKVEVTILGSTSLIVHTVSVDVKHHGYFSTSQAPRD